MNRYLSVLFVLFGLLAVPAWAQIKKEKQPSVFEEMQRQMQELQRQMMQELRANPFGELDGRSPFIMDTSFSFQFHVDTTINLGDGSFFQFRRFGSDSTMRNMFQDMDRMFGHFFDFGDEPGIRRLDGRRSPSEEWMAPQEEDGLLPEERLRLQEEGEKQQKTAPQSEKIAPKEGEKKKPIKTIRI